MSSRHGERTEDVLEDICSRMFGPDLVLRSPVVVEPSGDKELADILVLVDDTIVVIQSKSLEIDIAELNETDFGRIGKRHDKAKKQLNTLLNAANRKSEVRGTTCLGVEITLDWTLIRETIGIVTLNLPDEVYEDPEFRFQYPELYSEQRGLEIHSFVLRDLWEASVELTTPGDALCYLQARRECFKKNKVLIGNELDFLAFYKTDHPTIEQALTDPKFHIFITPGLWEDFRTGRNDEITDRAERYKSSYIIDTLVRHLRAVVEYSMEAHGLTAQESALRYLSVIGKLGKLARMERAKIGDKLLEKVDKAKTKKFGYFIYVSIRLRIAYLFLILNEDDREKRLNFVHFLAEKACHKVDATYLVAIGTDGAPSRSGGIDAMIVDVEDMKRNTNPDADMPMFGEAKVGRIDEWS